MKKKIETQNAPAAIGPYSQATECCGTLFVSGQLPINPANGELVSDVTKAAQQSLTNLKAIVTEAGFTMENVVKTTIFLTNMDDFAKVNEVYAQFFTAPFPARSTIAIKTLPKNAVLEIECIACK